MGRAPGRPTAPLLTEQAIVDEAVRLLATTGLSGFSLSTLAGALGVTPRAVRYRAGSKDAILLAVAERVTNGVSVPAEDLDWEDWLRLTATSVRAALLAEPALIPVAMQAWSATTRGAELAASSLDVLLDAAGGDLTTAVSTHNAFWAFVAGVVYSHAPAALRGAGRGTVEALSTVEDHAAVGAALDRLASAYAEAYPSAQAVDVAFADALDVTLAGIAATLGRRSAALGRA